MKPSVAGVCGTVRTTKSACGNSASSASGPWSSATPGGASWRRASTPITRMPNAAARRAASAPMPPTPTRSIVASGRWTTPVSSGSRRHSRAKLSREIVLEPPREREHEGHDVGADVVVEDLAEIRDDGGVRDQRLGIEARRAARPAAPAATGAGPPGRRDRPAGSRTRRRRRRSPLPPRRRPRRPRWTARAALRPSRAAQARVVAVCGGNMRSVGLGVMRPRQYAIPAPRVNACALPSAWASRARLLCPAASRDWRRPSHPAGIVTGSRRHVGC